MIKVMENIRATEANIREFNMVRDAYKSFWYGRAEDKWEFSNAHLIIWINSREVKFSIPTEGITKDILKTINDYYVKKLKAKADLLGETLSETDLIDMRK